MLRGPTWSGSIQQDLIEKLWVAILTCDVGEPKTSQESHNEKQTEGATCNDESEDSEGSSSSEDDSDSDLDLSELGAGLPQVDRYDLFSMVKVRQRQQDATESGDINAGGGDFKDANSTKEVDKASEATIQDIKSLDGEALRQENKNNVVLPVSVASPGTSAQNSSSSLSGAKPKVMQARPKQAAAPQGCRPRPNTLNFSSASPKSKIPQRSPVIPRAAPRTQNRKSLFSPASPLAAPRTNRKPPVKWNAPQPTRKGNHPERKSTIGVKQGPPSKIPISPTKAFNLVDRAHLLDVIPRKRLLSDPRQTRDHRNVKSNPVIWRRRAVTPEAARPYPLHRPIVNKESMEKPDARRYRQRQYYRGNSSRWSTQKHETDSTKRESCTANFVLKSRKDTKDDKTAINSQRKWRQTNGEKQGKNNIAVNPSLPRSNVTRGNITKSSKPNCPPSSVKSPGTSVRAANKEKNGATRSPVVQRRKSTTHRSNEKQKQGSIKQATENKENENVDVNKEINGQKETDGVCEIKEEEDNGDTDQGTTNSELHETTVYGSELEVTRLEDCLKEAILGVLQGLPDGWILAPEHTAELFSSLTSVVDSFPRPDHARARVLEAIVDAHARRPCGKGEIAALNNAHLLLYVGLKLCSQFAGRADTNKIHKEEETVTQKQTPKNEDEQRKAHDVNDVKDYSLKQKTCEGGEGDTPTSVIGANVKEGNSSKDTDKTSACKDTLSSCKLLEGKCFPLKGTKKQDILSDSDGSAEQNGIVLKILREIQKCEGSFDRLMMCLLLGSRAPGRGSGWYCETEEETEKVRDLRFVLENLKYVEGCRVSEVVSAPLWSCGSSPVVLAALAESPRLVLALLQYGAGGSAANHYLYSRCYTNGIYLAIAYLVRKLESQFKEPSEEENLQEPEGEDQPPAEDGVDAEVGPEGQVHIADGPGNEEVKRIADNTEKRDLLRLAGHTPTAVCLRYLLRAVPTVPIKFLRDQLGGCKGECGRDIAYLLPHTCCLQPPALLHLSRAACRQHLRIYDLLPRIIDDLDVPETLKDYLNLLRD